MSEVFNPGSTYRIQFHKDFTFEHLESIIPYLEELGIQTLYASPIFKAFPGSTHGYDGTNPNMINPEIGIEEELARLTQKLRAKGIQWLQDIVPNHLAYHHDNDWLMDVLEKGSQSDKAMYFDIDWNHPVNTGRLMAPFLAAKLDEEIDNGNLQLALNNRNEKYYLKYFDNYFPVNRASIDFLTAEPAPASSIQNEWQLIEVPKSVLKEIAGRQHYELCGWLETDKRINFRRFFTVNGLICTNIQNSEVFANYHQLIKKLLGQSVFQGLRIDHVDGLYDPRKYLEDLRKLAGSSTYIIVEKILAHSEALPASWPVQGTSGYDFLAIVNNVFTNAGSEELMTQFYHQLIQTAPSIRDEISKKKAYILSEYMGGELDNLIRLYVNTVDTDVEQDEIGSLKKELASYLVNCPVYRFYDAIPVMKRDEKKESTTTAAFYQRCMQFTGPLMAKGVEDTLMYTYNRFIGHNDVGDSPAYFGIPPDEFHRLMQQRQQLWPLALNTTSTHDTKRGEDARARLNALTDLAEEWTALCSTWMNENQSCKTGGAPDNNDEYFIYQTLVATYPFSDDEFEAYCNRLTEYFPKAFREGKVNSNWSAPDKEYEDAAATFIRKLFEKETFRKSFFPFFKKVKTYGTVNSLAQTILKFTSPGIPDLYQGTEMWDLSLVDPDNRRPVDYELRTQGLRAGGGAQALWEKRDDGRIKLQLVKKLLSLRKQFSSLLENGAYVPIAVTGTFRQHILAFQRVHEAEKITVVVPLGLGKLAEKQQKSPLDVDWKDTELALDDGFGDPVTDLVSNRKILGRGPLRIRELFDHLPMVVLYV